jgi:hypothetical protein
VKLIKSCFSSRNQKEVKRFKETMGTLDSWGEGTELLKIALRTSKVLKP